MFERKRSSVIKDSSKLSFEYVPVNLVNRECQMNAIEKIFRPVIEEGRSETAFLIGNVGTGKTATAKRFCLNLLDYGAANGIALGCIIVNCRQRYTESAVLLQLVRHVDPGFPDRGFSSAEMMRAFKGKVTKSGKKYIIILDEADILLKKGSKDLVYQLSRFNEESFGGSSSISLIMISQENILDMLDDASISTFKRANAIKFNRYTRDELHEIVVARAGEALDDGCASDDALDLIADIASEYGDARFAIEMLDRAAHEAEMNDAGKVTSEEVRAAKAMIYSVVTESRLEQLDTNHMMALLAISRSIKDKAYVTIGAAEKTYAIVCEEYNVTARKHTQFWSYVQDLERQTLIASMVKGDDSGGRTTYISLPDIPSKELAHKLETLLG